MPEPFGPSKVRDAAVGTRADEGNVDGDAGDGLAGLEIHEGEGFREGGLLLGRRRAADGKTLVDRHVLTRVDAPGDRRRQAVAVDLDPVVEVGVRVTRDAAPVRQCAFEGLPRRRELASGQILEGGFVGVDVAAARPPLDGHVADGEALLDGHRLDDRAGVLVGEADAPLDSQRANDGQDHVFGVDPGGELSGDIDAPNLRPGQGQALGCEDIAQLARTDAEGDGAKGSVGRRVTVAAGDGHAGEGQSELGADHVDDALALPTTSCCWTVCRARPWWQSRTRGWWTTCGVRVNR